MQKTLLILVAALGLTLAGCSTTEEKIDEKTDIEALNAQELQDSATRALKNGNYTRAVQVLEEIDTRYPFGRISEATKLQLIYAYFKKGEYESGQTLADRFIRQHPQHDRIDYVFNLKGIMYYEQEIGFFKEVFNADIHTRDTTNLKAAFDSFKTLVEVYPESKYAPDARQRMIHLRNLLAESQLHAAKFYMERDSYVGAANRAKYIVESFPKTPAVAPALEILINCYKFLELPELAEQYRRVLLLNYPDYNLADF